ncbi:PREDICTED: uncharacterized protein LOC109127485 [Camelina sativa]|uniref:Uncharacterized protein LOC109126920 n=1 Tax=Camelina sativa TaxID=90675 RepID=A0ABM1QI19_CAMSA|nr:PREDICTED: uncharacterized protein LOC109126920 [Camelina sativa]XP_019087855.1 PREDICTED: uncharacterized protein LOC109127485 [Camelina sativa]
MRNPPPSLLSLTVNAAVLNLSRINDLSHLPDHIILDLFARTLKAGKLNERVLRLFMASGNEEVLSIIDALKIKINVSPILPTRCHEKFRLNGTRR